MVKHTQTIICRRIQADQLTLIPSELARWFQGGIEVSYFALILLVYEGKFGAIP